MRRRSRRDDPVIRSEKPSVLYIYTEVRRLFSEHRYTCKMKNPMPKSFLFVLLAFATYCHAQNCKCKTISSSTGIQSQTNCRFTYHFSGIYNVNFNRYIDITNDTVYTMGICYGIDKRDEQLSVGHKDTLELSLDDSEHIVLFPISAYKAETRARMKNPAYVTHVQPRYTATRQQIELLRKYKVSNLRITFTGRQENIKLKRKDARKISRAAKCILI